MKSGGIARELAVTLVELPIEWALRQALSRAFEQLAERLQAALSTLAPMEGLSSISHDAPWLRAAALRNGVLVRAEAAGCG